MFQKAQFTKSQWLLLFEKARFRKSVWLLSFEKAQFTKSQWFCGLTRTCIPYGTCVSEKKLSLVE
jgi:hypothetical protein